MYNIFGPSLGRDILFTLLLMLLSIRISMHLSVMYQHAVKEWLSVLLPLALDREVCIITNMGASKTMLTVVLLYLIGFVFSIRYCKCLSHLLVDPPGAQKEILDLASSLGLEITVAVAYESSISGPGNFDLFDSTNCMMLWVLPGLCINQGVSVIIAWCVESKLIIKLTTVLGFGLFTENSVLSNESVGVAEVISSSSFYYVFI